MLHALEHSAARHIAGYGSLPARRRAAELSKRAGVDPSLLNAAMTEDAAGTRGVQRAAIAFLEQTRRALTHSHPDTRVPCMTAESNSIVRAGELLAKLRTQVGNALVGQNAIVDQTIMALLVSGHVLIEGVPGLGKTLLVRALAQAMSLKVGRIQFTPDLMPSDITGHAILDPSSHELRVVRGPVFTNVLLADEINRAPAKTQSALLEVMQEYQVTLEGGTLALPRPFIVLATQNPLETEGTYPLPEAQLDRFLLKIDMTYPSLSEEIDIVAPHHHRPKRRTIAAGQRGPPCSTSGQCWHYSTSPPAKKSMPPSSTTRCASRGLLATGPASPWAAARAAPSPWCAPPRRVALMASRSFVLPDDVKTAAPAALRHRMALSADAQLDGRKVDDLLHDILDATAAPRA